MKSAIAELVGESPYSQSKHYDKIDVPELKGELHDAYEQRTWRNRMHITSDGYVEIPGPQFANAIKEAAKRMSIKIKGRGHATYTKPFEAGVMVTSGIKLPIKAADVKYDKMFVPADGKPGGPRRVNRYFPRIDEWTGFVTYYIFDDIITQDIFLKTLAMSGQLVGLGRFRPMNRGYYGRFSVKSLQWHEEEDTLQAISG